MDDFHNSVECKFKSKPLDITSKLSIYFIYLELQIPKSGLFYANHR